MKKNTVFLIMISLALLLMFGCQLRKEKEVTNVNPLIKPLFEIFLAKHYEADLQNVPLEEKPVVTDKDIKKYFWNTHEIEFTDEYLNKLKGAKPERVPPSSSFHGGSNLLGAKGLDTFVVVVKGQRLYLGRFKLASISSLTPGPIEIEDVNDRRIRIGLNGKIEDPRNDKRIYNVIKEVGKLIEE